MKLLHWLTEGEPFILWFVGFIADLFWSAVTIAVLAGLGYMLLYVNHHGIH